MRKPLLIVTGLLAATLTHAPAHAAPEDSCKARGVSVDERLAGCTAMIDANRETGRSMAMAYCNRGFALTEKRELDRALADLEEAIKLDPTYPCSFSNRGRVFAFKGDLDRAMADYEHRDQARSEFRRRLQQPRRCAS